MSTVPSGRLVGDTVIDRRIDARDSERLLAVLRRLPLAPRGGEQRKGHDPPRPTASAP